MTEKTRNVSVVCGTLPLVWVLIIVYTNHQDVRVSTHFSQELAFGHLRHFYDGGPDVDMSRIPDEELIETIERDVDVAIYPGPSRVDSRW